MQEVRKSQNQHGEPSRLLSINSGKLESSSGDFPGSRRLWAAASSFGLKGPEVLPPQVVGYAIVQTVPALCAPFFMSCEAGVCQDGAQAGPD